MTYANSTQKQYRYQLSRKGKHKCPACGRKTFVRYIDKSTGQEMPEQFGRCDRADKCGHKEYPKGGQSVAGWIPIAPLKKSPPIPLPETILQSTRTKPIENNPFLKNLFTEGTKAIARPFLRQDVQKVADLYKVGLYGTRTAFPFIDPDGKVRAIQVKGFDETNHTSIKPNLIDNLIQYRCENYNEPVPSWLEAYQKQDTRLSCLFGAHLLKLFPNNRVGIVEAPKTAIYAALYYGLPKSDTEILWLSSYSVTGLTIDRCMDLKGRTVYLYPDLSIFEDDPKKKITRADYGRVWNYWKKRANELNKEIPGAKFIVSDMLEQMATPQARADGKDLADFLAEMDWMEFRKG